MAPLLLQPVHVPAGCVFRPATLTKCRVSVIPRAAGKGFGAEPKVSTQKPQQEGETEEAAPSLKAATSGPADKDAEALEALEARIKKRRRVEAKVKVSAPAVDIATGKAPASQESEAEQIYLAFLGSYFILLLLSGLALAGSGFLPEAIDQFITDELYPAYSWMMLGFLGLSSLYGLFKTGKLPGQQQQP